MCGARSGEWDSVIDVAHRNLASKKFIRIKRYTPAVTKVKEWTNEEMGVGGQGYSNTLKNLA